MTPGRLGRQVPRGTKHLDLLVQHLLRKGLFGVDKTELRSYVEHYTQKTLKGIREPTNPNAEKNWSVPPAEFVDSTRRDTVMRQARFPYRSWIYLYDEIFEILGGYKGRSYMPLPEFIKMSEDLIMDGPTPCYPSFMQQDLDAGNQTLLPNDIPARLHLQRQRQFRRAVHAQATRAVVEADGGMEADPGLEGRPRPADCPPSGSAPSCTSPTTRPCGGNTGTPGIWGST